MPRKGDIAFCAHNFLGLITSDQTENEPSISGNIGAEIWTGIQLTNRNNRVVGGPWQSRNPRIIAHAPWLLTLFEKATKWDELQADREAERERLAKQSESVPAYVRTGPPLNPRLEKKGGPFDIEAFKRAGGLVNPPEPGNLFPRQPYEPVRYAADGLFEGDTDYNGD